MLAFPHYDKLPEIKRFVLMASVVGLGASSEAEEHGGVSGTVVEHTMSFTWKQRGEEGSGPSVPIKGIPAVTWLPP